MKAEVTMTKRPKSGDVNGRKLRCLDLSLDGWTPESNGAIVNGRKPHGGYKGLQKHPMGIHSFNRGPEYQHQLLEARHSLDHQDRQSPTWAVSVHTLPTHSGESPLFSARLLSASKHEVINGRDKQEVTTPRSTRCSTPSPKKGTTYYRPNRTHQYLSATELRDSTDNEEVLKYGRPTRTTLLRARHRCSSATTSALEARRQKEQRIMEVKKVTAFCNPEEMVPVYSDSEDQSFYSFLLGARYNRAHCLDSKSLSRHGVYMPRNNPLGCFVLDDRELDTVSAPAESPRSEADLGSRPQTARQRRPTTAPSYGRKSSARSPRHVWGDVTVSLHVANGKGQTLTLSRDRNNRFEPKLPVVHGTSLSKLQKQFREAAAVAAENSESLQPPPSPISTRGDNSLLTPSNTHEPPAPARPNEPPSHPPSPVPEEEEEDRKETENQNEKAAEESPTTEQNDEKIQEEKKEEMGKQSVEKEQREEENERCVDEKGEEIRREEVEEKEEEKTIETKEKAPAAETDQPSDVISTINVTETEEENVIAEPDVSQAEANPPIDEKDKEDPVTFFVTEQAADDDENNDNVLQNETNNETVNSEVQINDNAPDVKNNPDDAIADENSLNKSDVIADENDLNQSDVKADDDVSSNKDGDEEGEVTNSNKEEDKEVEEASLPTDPTTQEEKSQPDDDAQSTTSSKKSLSKRVSFKIPPSKTQDSDAEENNNNNDNVDDEEILNGSGLRQSDAVDGDIDDSQSQGQSEEPLKVIVTHIERNMGAPVSKDNEGEVIAKNP